MYILIQFKLNNADEAMYSHLLWILTECATLTSGAGNVDGLWQVFLNNTVKHKVKFNHVRFIKPGSTGSNDESIIFKTRELLKLQ